MIDFQVDGMSCGHCVRAITQAVQAADPGAQVQVDLATRRVQVQPVAADADVLRAAIEEAGYKAAPAP